MSAPDEDPPKGGGPRPAATGQVPEGPDGCGAIEPEHTGTVLPINAAAPAYRRCERSGCGAAFQAADAEQTVCGPCRTWEAARVAHLAERRHLVELGLIPPEPPRR